MKKRLILSAVLGSMLQFLAACSPQPTKPVIVERLVVPPMPNCDPLPLDWSPEFEAKGRPARELIAEFDRRADALTYAGGALACWRGWSEGVRSTVTGP